MTSVWPNRVGLSIQEAHVISRWEKIEKFGCECVSAISAVVPHYQTNKPYDPSWSSVVIPNYQPDLVYSTNSQTRPLMSQLVDQLTKIPNHYHETAPLQTVPIETNVELASTKNRQIPIKTLLTISAGITSTENNETSGLLMSVLTEAKCIQTRSVNQMTKKIRKKRQRDISHSH